MIGNVCVHKREPPAERRRQRHFIRDFGLMAAACVVFAAAVFFCVFWFWFGELRRVTRGSRVFESLVHSGHALSLHSFSLRVDCLNIGVFALSPFKGRTHYAWTRCVTRHVWSVDRMEIYG